MKQKKITSKNNNEVTKLTSKNNNQVKENNKQK